MGDMVAEIERQSKLKRDFVADSRCIEMQHPASDEDSFTLGLFAGAADDRGEDRVEYFGVSDRFHEQVGSRHAIPKAYYDRLRSQAPELLVANVNHWFKADGNRKLVRTLDGRARAYLSDRYRALDNYDLLQAALPELMKQPNIQIVSCEVTEARMYLKAVFPKLEGEIKTGDIVQAGLVVSNSEIGAGSVRVEPLVYRLVCKNGMISNTAMRRYHVGKQQAGEGDFTELLTDKTKEMTDAAFWAQVRDVISGSLTDETFQRQVLRLREAATEQPITGNVVKVVEVTQKKLGFSDTEGQMILQHLIQGGSLSAYGLMNAITRTSQDVDDYDRATELERAGGKLIELDRKDWRVIAEAA